MTHKTFIFGGREYKIDIQGNVMRLDGRGYLTPHVTRGGYLQLTTSDSSRKRHHIYVHRAVYETFIGKVPDGFEIDHIDNDKSNNCLGNLQLLSRQENVEKSKSKVFNLISPDGERISVFNLTKFCRELGLDVRGLHAAVTGSRGLKSYKGWSSDENR